MVPIVEAIHPASPIKAKDNQDYQPLFDEGKRAFDSKEWVSAELALKQAVAINGKSLEALLLLGQTLIEGNKLLEALDFLKNTNNSFPNQDSILFYLGIVQERLHRYDNAEQTYRQTLSLTPENPKILLRLATVLIKLGKNEDAQSFLENLTKKHPSYTIAWWNLGLLHWKLGSWEASRDAWKRAVDLDPKNIKYQKYYQQAKQRAR